MSTHDTNIKNILVCSTNYLPHIGGAELAVHEIAKRLAIRGYVFDLITARLDAQLPSYEYMDGVHVYRVGFGFWGDKFLLPILGLVRYSSLRRKPDIIWSLMASQGSVLASYVSIFTKQPILLTLQEGDEEEHLNRYTGGSSFLYEVFIKPWHTLVFKRAKRITVISEHLKKRAERYSRAPIDLVPNGVSLSVFAEKNIQRVDAIRRMYDLVGKKVVVSVSRLVKKNNIAMLIRALAHVSDDIVLLLVGDGEEKEMLEREAARCGVEHRIIFAGNVSPDDVPHYLHVADIFARVSLSEGFGSAFLESFAAGVPVIASPVGGIVDIVKDGETGLLVPPNDEKALAEAIQNILSDDALKQRLIENGRIAAQKYDWDAIANLMERSLDQI